MIEDIKTRYHELNPQGTLKIYQVPKASLKKYAPADDRKYNFDYLPPNRYRQRDQELRGINEEEEDPDDSQDMSEIFNKIDGNLDNIQTR